MRYRAAALLSLLSLALVGSLFLSAPHAQTSPDETVVFSKDYKVGWIHLLLAYDSFSHPESETATLRITRLRADKDLRGGLLRFNSDWISGFRDFVRGDGEVFEQEVALKGSGSNTIFLYLRGDKDASIRIEVVTENEVQEPTATLLSSAESITYGESLELSWTTDHADSVTIEPGLGAVDASGNATVTPTEDTTYTLTATGPGGEATASVVVDVQAATAPQPRGSFGDQYQDLIPPNATIEAFEPERFAVITGKVTDAGGTPLSGVSVTVHGDEELYGTAKTDAEGRYSIPVNGGGNISVIYRKDGHLEVQRKNQVRWNEIVVMPTASMIQEDTRSTTVVPDGDPTHFAVHQSTVINDEDGIRAASIVFPGDIQAYRVEANGTETELTSFNVRVTEYPTPESMPAILPPTSDFTWCGEFTVDGAKEVRFSEPVVGWLDNFLGFEVGTFVPVGFYDRTEGVWKPMDDGLVVELLDTDGDGIVDALDGDGDGEADDLDGDDNFADEVEGLDDPTIYAPGTTYWRYYTDHFSPIDLNWCVLKGIMAADEFPEVLPPGECDDCVTVTSSGDVNPRYQSSNEEVPIPGTGLSLHYSSGRTPSYEQIITVKATRDTISDDMLTVHVRLEIAGRVFEDTMSPDPDAVVEFAWDGTDYLGRISEVTRADVYIGYEYDSQYLASMITNSGSGSGSGGSGGGSDGSVRRSFAELDVSLTYVNSREQFIAWKKYSIDIPMIRKEETTVATGWEYSAVHTVNNSNDTLFKGNGDINRRNALLLEETITDEQEFRIRLESSDFAFDNAGNVYFGGDRNDVESYLYRIDKDGNAEKIGGATNSYNVDPHIEDGVPATESYIHISSMEVLDNGDIITAGGKRIRRIDSQTNIITTIAGGDEIGATGDGGPAIDAKFSDGSLSIAKDSTGNIYVCDRGNYRIRKISPDGFIDRAVGNGEYRSPIAELIPDGTVALDVNIGSVAQCAVNPATNELYFTLLYAIYKLRNDGTLERVAGNLNYDYSGDGGPARDAELRLSVSSTLTFDQGGNLYVADTGNSRIRKIDTSGIISTVAGNGERSFPNQDGPALETPLIAPRLIAIRDDGALLYMQIRGSQPFVSFFQISYADASAAFDLTTGEVVFSENGVSHIFEGYSRRHLRTVDQDSGVTLYSMTYDDEGKLLAITDRFGDATTMEYDAGGKPSAIVSPDGHRTQLVVDANGHLTRIVNPDGGAYQFEYDPDGLLTHKIDPDGHEYFREYDEHGRVARVWNQEGGEWTFTRAAIQDNATGYPVGSVRYETLTAEGQRTTYVDLGNSTGYYSEITDPAGGVTTFHHSTDERHVEKSLPCGTDLVVDYANDPRYMYDYPASITRSIPSGKSSTTTQSIGYADADSDGVPETKTHTVSVDGRTATQVTDLLNGVVAATSPEGRTATEEYDPATLLTSRKAVPGLFDTTYQYDARGRVTGVASGNRTVAYTYDGQGNVATVTDAQNRTTSYTYDVMDRVTSVTRPDETTVRFDWSKNGNLEVLTVPSDVDHGFEYDNTDRNTAYDPPISPSYQYIYDNDHRLVRTVFPSGQAIENVYENGQLRRVKTPEGDVVLDYLCSSKIGTITMGAEFLDFEYDGPLVTSLEQGGELSALLTFGYDDTMRLESFGYAGETTTFGYDLDGLLTTIGDFAIERDADNGLPLAVDDETARLEREFNGYGEVERQTLTVNGNDVGEVALTRDDVGRITAKTETIAGLTHEYAYEYDDFGRLTVVRDGTGNELERYTYGPQGERLSETNVLRGIVSRSFTYDDEDRLLTAGSAEYEFDTDGFLTSKTDGSETTTYDYSSRGELKQVELPGGEVVEYRHDPMGRRVAKLIDGNVVEKYLWMGRTRLLAVYNGDGSLKSRFLYADGRMPMGMVQNGETFYFAYDQVGSLRAVADETGSVVKTVRYDSFGNIIEDSNPNMAVPFGFAGGLHDRDTGLVRFGFRDYGPDTGRWTAKDPIGFAAGEICLYCYLSSKPVNGYDVDGLFARPVAEFLLKKMVKNTLDSLIEHVIPKPCSSVISCIGVSTAGAAAAGAAIGAPAFGIGAAGGALIGGAAGLASSGISCPVMILIISPMLEDYSNQLEKELVQDFHNAMDYYINKEKHNPAYHYAP